jgi:hypothetical protein
MSSGCLQHKAKCGGVADSLDEAKAGEPRRSRAGGRDSERRGLVRVAFTATTSPDLSAFSRSQSARPSRLSEWPTTTAFWRDGARTVYIPFT